MKQEAKIKHTSSSSSSGKTTPSLDLAASRLVKNLKDFEKKTQCYEVRQKSPLWLYWSHLFYQHCCYLSISIIDHAECCVSGHEWSFAKMNIEDIMLLDFYGGVKHIDIKEYFKATPFWNNTLYESFIFYKKMVVNVKDGNFSPMLVTSDWLLSVSFCPVGWLVWISVGKADWPQLCRRCQALDSW